MRRYATPSLDLAENRALFAMPMVLLSVAVNAYSLAEDSLWFATALAVAGVATIPQRPTAFEATLPIRGRDIALARLLSALGLSFATLALSVAISAPRAETQTPMMHYCIAVLIVLLGILAPRLTKPRQFAINPLEAFPPLLALLAAVVASLMYLPDVSTVAWLSVAVVVAGVWWWRLVPDSYQAASMLPSADTPVAHTSSTGSNTGWWRMVARSLFSFQRVFVSAAMLFGGATGQWWMLLYTGVSIEELWQRTRWMQSLPISRRKRFWLIFGPGVVLPLVMGLIGTQLHISGLEYAHNLRRRAPGTYRQEPSSVYFDSPTNVSTEYWERAPNSSAPVITAPWGETAQPYVIRVFSAVYYNPYTSRYTSSDRFMQWQFRRLTTAVYGFPVEFKDYDPKAKQPPRMTETPRMVVLNAAALLLLFTVYLLVIGIGKMYRFWKHNTLVIIATHTIAILPMLLVLFVVKRYGMEQGTTDIVFPLAEHQLMRLSAALPDSLVGVVLLAALPLLAMYALLQWQFNRSEIVGAVTAVNAR